MLWSLLALPLLVATYVAHLSRRREVARRYAALLPAAEARGARSALRHLPAGLLFVAIAALLVSAARPTVVLPLPAHHETVILAIDVSHSMRAEDAQPNRLAAAQSAARAFIQGQRPTTRIGLVAFSGEARLVQAATEDREALGRAVDSLQTQDATAIGAAILASVQALLPEAAIGPDAPGPRDALYGSGRAAPKEPGLLDSAAVILLSDGQNTVGPDAMDSAYLAAEHGVRIYTVGFGTSSGTTVGGPGWSVHVYLDEPLLRDIAATTRAEYFHAETAAELNDIYRKLTSTLVLESKPTELTVAFCIAAMLAALLAGGLSLVSFRPVTA